MEVYRIRSVQIHIEEHTHKKRKQIWGKKILIEEEIL